uniref:Uncharacterized protein n=1 Tax=viral metagenome TaxID=1070528 RepID=A0A6H2A443_9ZZZZ
MPKIPEKLKHAYYAGHLNDSELKEIIADLGYTGNQATVIWLVMRDKKVEIHRAYLAYLDKRRERNP